MNCFKVLSFVYLLVCAIFFSQTLFATGASITSTPCVVKEKQNMCKTKISWNSDIQSSCIFVRVNGGRQQLMGCSGTSGSVDVEWIAEENNYQFILHQNEDVLSKVLSIASVRSQKENRIFANKLFCTLNKETGRCNESDIEIKHETKYSTACVFASRLQIEEMQRDSVDDSNNNRNSDLKLWGCSGGKGSYSPTWLVEGLHRFVLKKSGDVNSETLDEVVVHSIVPQVGVNILDLTMRAFNLESSNENYKRVSSKLAKKSLDDAAASGFNLVRFTLLGYEQAFINEAISNPRKFWGDVKDLFDYAHKLKVRLNPVFFFFGGDQISRYLKTYKNIDENPREFYANINSESRKIAYKLIDDYFKYVKSHPAVEFISLGNEMNSFADIVPRLNVPNDKCFTTTELVGLSRDFANKIKSYNPYILLAAGHSIARPSAFHLDQSQKCGDGLGNWVYDWTLDSYEEFYYHMQNLHSAFDIVEVHFYNGDLNRFGRNHNDAEILKDIIKFTDENNKILFLGEFSEGTEEGLHNSNPYHIESSEFIKNTLAKIIEYKIPYSAYWAWEFYQFKIYRAMNYIPTAPENLNDYRFVIEPGFRHNLIHSLQKTNYILNGRLDPSANIKERDNKEPTCFISWPLNASTIDTNTNSEDLKMLAVQVSDIHNGRINPVNVKVTATGKRFDRGTIVKTFTLDKYPYQMQMPFEILPIGEMRLEIEATDPSGNICRDEIKVNLQ